MNLDKIRMEYNLGKLDISNLPPDPFELFQLWLEAALNSEEPEPTAMVVSTIDRTGFPQSRVVLLKSAESTGFTFFSNYLSNKGQEIEFNPKTSLLFFWPQLQRQVRITGISRKVDRKESEQYFNSRPEGSRLGAWASDQSREIPSREYLEEKYKQYSELYRNHDIPVPPHWGGYRVTPVRYEFWQGRESRLHDRFTYEQEGEAWKIKRLSP